MAAKAVQITNVFVLRERAAALVVLSDNREVMFQCFFLRKAITRQRKTGKENIVK
jgi:hypothetical protein